MLSNPGERLITGGDLFSRAPDCGSASYFTGLYSLILQYKDAPFFNSCELAGFLTFAPAGMILACYSIFKTKKKDALSIALIAFELVCLYFLAVGVPAAVAKATLLSQCKRMNIALGLADCILLIRNLSFCKEMPVPLAAGSALVSTALNILMLYYFYRINGWMLAALIGLYLIIFYLLFRYQNDQTARRRMLTFVLFCVMLSVGAFVNPVQQGIKCATETNLVKTLNSIEDTAGDLYIVESGSPYTNVPLLAGKTCFDSTQVYPDIKKWEAVDPTGQYTDVYNRFCHISLDLTENETSFVLLHDDAIRIDFCIDDLETYGVRYLVTTKEYSSYHNCRFTLVGTADEWNVYQIMYDDDAS